MIANSLHFFVECGNKDVSSRLSNHRRILKTARAILKRQNHVFYQALKNGSDDVPFNGNLVAWAKEAKIEVSKANLHCPVTTNINSILRPSISE